jgi:hypothetical protein
MTDQTTPEPDVETPDHSDEVRRIEREADELSEPDAAIRQPPDEDDEGVGGVTGLVP